MLALFLEALFAAHNNQNSCFYMNILFGAYPHKCFIIFICNNLNLTQSVIHIFIPPIACIFQWHRSIILQLEVPIKIPLVLSTKTLRYLLIFDGLFQKRFSLYYQGISLWTRIPTRVLVSTADQSTWSHFQACIGL